MVGLSADREVLEGIVKRLDGKSGLSVCENTDWECHDQWAYPSYMKFFGQYSIRVEAVQGSKDMHCFHSYGSNHELLKRVDEGILKRF